MGSIETSNTESCPVCNESFDIMNMMQMGVSFFFNMKYSRKFDTSYNKFLNKKVQSSLRYYSPDRMNFCH